MGITVESLTKRFGSFLALDDINLEVKTGSLVALLGPSGSGKSTLLRAIAGLEPSDTGRIYLTGRDATYETVQQRNIGFVFQHYALFKHLTIKQNIAFGLDIRKVNKKQALNRAQELLELVQLSGLGNRYPSQLSGGQRQRVALARALAVQPKVLLLDEPFGALDAKVRKDLRNWLRQLIEQVKVTTVFVTHDQEEAMEVSDEIVVMNQGRIEQVGTPAEVYDHPATSFVMSFIGPVNVIPGSSRLIKNSGFDSSAPKVFVRPHDVLIETSKRENSAPAKVNRLIHLGWEIVAELIFDDGQTITANLTREEYGKLNLQAQQQVFVRPKFAKSFPLDYSI
ncbi:MAG: sulfate/molybdate ABC transporter ATP-binding protein [Nostocales cyanobacterium 94392]|nr:sulfate/molybdate ABC transporter ATP-binding protein [Nostocales cyanobacterium 94392]